MSGIQEAVHYLKRIGAGSTAVLALIAALALGVALPMGGCSRKTEGKATPEQPPAAPATDPTSEAEALLARSSAIDNSDSTVRLRSRVIDEGSPPREVQMIVYRKRDSDQRRLMLLEITSPIGEKDRSGLVVSTAEGEVEGTRYVQSNNSFVTSRSAVNEDSLFGMSLQELVGGQPEKYEQRLIGEESLGSEPVYKIEGKLKPGFESGFARVVTYISKSNNFLLGADYYDNHDQLVRSMRVHKVGQVNGHWTRMLWTIDNITKKKKAEFETLSARYQQLPSSIFSRDHLKAVATR
jgi:Outer membrane lipoprotein-sorting protein